MIWVLKSRESGGRLNYYHTFSVTSRESGGRLCYDHTFSTALGAQVHRKNRKWRASQLLPYFPCYFGCSSRVKVESVPAIIIVFLLLLVLMSRESEGCLSYSHTFPFALGTRVKRKWRTSRPFSYFFSYFGSSSQEKVKDLPAIIILFNGDRMSSLGSFDSKLLQKDYKKTPSKVRRPFHGTSFRPLIVAKHLEISSNDDEEASSNQAHFGGSFFF